jgi:hypothetical protein
MGVTVNEGVQMAGVQEIDVFAVFVQWIDDITNRSSGNCM